MAKTVADQFAETLAAAGVKRIYGIVGDSLNGLTDAIRRQGRIEWVHVRHEEAEAVGVKGVRIEKASEVEPGIRAALAHDGTVLIDAVVNRQELAIPPKITAEMAKGFTLYMIKAVMNGRTDEVLDLASTNLWR